MKINFGLKKRMTVAGASEAADYVYAFSTEVGSSWIPLAAVRAIVKDGAGQPAFKAYDRPAPRPSARVLRSVSVAKFRSAEDYGVTFEQFSGSGVSLRYLPRWARLKVRPKSEVAQAVDPRGRGPSEMARDYLLRDFNAVNLMYQTPLLGGAATDTFIVRQNGLSFRRLRTTNGKKTVLKIWLYEPLVQDHATGAIVSPGTRRRGKMYFVYGRAGGRYGWVAAEALRAGPECTKGDDGWFCAPDGSGYRCDDAKVTERKTCAEPGLRCTGTSDVDRATLAPNAELVCDRR